MRCTSCGCTRLRHLDGGRSVCTGIKYVTVYIQGQGNQTFPRRCTCLRFTEAEEAT